MCMGKFKINKMFAISHIYTYALERQKDREGDRERGKERERLLCDKRRGLWT